MAYSWDEDNLEEMRILSTPVPSPSPFTSYLPSPSPSPPPLLLSTSPPPPSPPTIPTSFPTLSHAQPSLPLPAHFSSSSPPQNTIPSLPTNALLHDVVKTLLTERESNIEDFIKNFVKDAENQSDADELLDEADEQALLSEADNKLAEASLLLSHKYGTVLKAHLSRKQQLGFTKSYSKLPKNYFSKSNLCFVYSQCFAQWINSGEISFCTLNKSALGALSAKDCFIAHLFSMATCRRVKGDDCYALSVVGKSSVGKTRMIEHCLQQASFTYASEPGVGRFNVKHRPILLYRDIDITKLVKGADSSKFRTICRSEMTSVKVHSSTVTLPPLWVLISANQRINSHFFPVTPRQATTAATKASAPVSPAKKSKNDIKDSNSGNSNSGNSSRTAHFNAFNWDSASSSGKNNGGGGNNSSKSNFNSTLVKISSFPSNYPTQLIPSGKRDERQDESIKAVQNRVLELFVREKPDLTTAPLPTGVIFQRSHLVVGIFDTIIDILERHAPADFYSPVLVSYLLTGLADNLALYKSLWLAPEMAEANKTRITLLILKYAADSVDQQNAYLAKLGANSL